MKFERLRVTGFKSFCDAAEFKIESGLTGVVGPNGCGKSNLVEALRWVMGESSFKAMRGSGMDDVIFSGSGKRPSRNIAEVGLLLDNSDRTAPAAFNEHQTIEVTRRIEREAGSTYRVNGKEVRARDVQLLFADASTGSRSPALVRQGQIGEIIAAKPQARRLILEEAAGVAGLHSRRHEAELRLKGAEDNLLRVEDVLKQIDVQIEGLRRQARQSSRYRILAADIRRHAALAHLVAWREHETAFAEARRKLDADLLDVAERTRAQGEAARLQAIAAADLPALREEEARRGAALHRITLARAALEAEQKRAGERMAEIERRAVEFARDLQREQALIADAASVMERLAAEDVALAEALDNAGAAAEARAREEAAKARLAATEAELTQAQAASSDLNARRHALGAGAAEEGRRLARFEAECERIERELAGLRASDFEEAEREQRAKAAAERAEALQTAEQQTLAAEERHTQAREAEARSRGPARRRPSARRRRSRPRRAPSPTSWARAPRADFPPVVDAIAVARGYEAALGAALGDDLDAPIDEAAPAHWSLVPPDAADPQLPDGVEPLAARVAAPPALARRLAQVGVVPRADGERLSTLSAARPAARFARGRPLALGRLCRRGRSADAGRAAARRKEPARRSANERPRRARAAVEVVRAEAQHAGVEARARPPPPRPNGATRVAPPAPLPTPPATRSPTSSASATQTLTRLSARRGGRRPRQGRARRIGRAQGGGRSGDARPRSERGADAEARARPRPRRRSAGGARRGARRRAKPSARGRSARQAPRRRSRPSASRGTSAASAPRPRSRRSPSGARATRRSAKSSPTRPHEFARRRRALADEFDAAEAARKEASDARAAAETALADADRAARQALDAMAAGARIARRLGGAGRGGPRPARASSCRRW